VLTGWDGGASKIPITPKIPPSIGMAEKCFLKINHLKMPNQFAQEISTDKKTKIVAVSVLNCIKILLGIGASRRANY